MGCISDLLLSYYVTFQEARWRGSQLCCALDKMMEKLINLGVDGIITDYPDLLLSLSEGNK